MTDVVNYCMETTEIDFARTQVLALELYLFGRQLCRIGEIMNNTMWII